MAALNRPVTATYAVNETVCVDTLDNEDHSFCGIMFPIRAKNILPIERIILQSVAVRGQLGDISIWISNSVANSDATNNRNNQGLIFRLHSKYWTKVYEKKHKPSQHTYQTMDLTTSETPVFLLPGEVRMMYIHSTLESDTAIVYDNAPTNMFGGPMNHNVSSIRYEDDKIAIHTGKAHLSFIPFGQDPIWGWGNAWRDRREFVGQIKYGTVYKLWHPERHTYFGNKFRSGTESLLMLQRRDTLFSRLPDECIYYILNMCRWDWFNDSSREMKFRYRNRKRIQREQQRRILQEHVVGQEMNVARAKHSTEEEKCCDCTKRNNNGDDEADDIEMDSDDDMKEHAEDDNMDESDDEEEEEEEEGNEEEDDDDEDESSDWERAHGYRADTSQFIFHNVSSDEEDEDEDENNDNADDPNHNGVQHHHHPWFGHRVARQLVVRALGGARNRVGR